MNKMEVKFAGNSGAAEIVGYASLFGGAPDAVGDVVAPGAFRASLAAGLPDMLREHNGASVGRWTKATEDDLGLRVEGTVTDAATINDLRAGRLDGLSIGYVTERASHAPNGSRILDQVSLSEISLVRNPAKSSARVLSIKSEGNKMNAQTDQNESVVQMEDRVGAVEIAISDLDKRLAAVEQNGQVAVKSLERIETTLRRPGAAAVESKSAGESEMKVFLNFARRGVERMEAGEAKSLRVSDDSQGGYLAPDQFVTELLRNVVQFSPIRGLARVANTGSGNVQLPKRTGTLTGHWVEETGTRPGTSPAYGQNQYPVKELACYVDVSNSLLEDSAFDLASELAFDFAEEFGKVEGTAFVSGDGVGKPFGFMQDAALLSTNSGGASTITADGLIQIYHDLAPAYRGNATWVMNSNTLATVRKLKDGTTGQFLLLTAGTFGAAPTTTLFGRPVIEAPDMPDVAGGAYPLAFGDFKAGYRIFDRVALSVLRDPYSQATSGLVRFHARRRVAGGVAKAEAIRKLKIAA